MTFLGLYLDQIDGAVPLLILITLLVIMGQLIFRRLFARYISVETHETAGHYFAVVSTIYAVTLGLVVFDALGTYESANQTVRNEARSLFAVYSLLDRFPDSERMPLQETLQAYVDAVIHSEWQRMNNQDECPLSRKLMFELMEGISKLKASTSSEVALLPLLSEQMINAVDSARTRLQQNEEGIPDIEWYVLLSGAGMTILFSYFFNASGVAQLTMTIMLALIIGSNLILVLAFGEPFKGGFQVSNAEFKILQQHMTMPKL
jgi:Protein of unknown function (DUF4239)